MKLFDNEIIKEIKAEKEIKGVNLDEFREYFVDESFKIPTWLSDFNITKDVVKLKTSDDIKTLGHEDLNDEFIEYIGGKSIKFENEHPSVLFLFHEMKYIINVSFNDNEYPIYLDMVDSIISTNDIENNKVYVNLDEYSDEELKNIKNEMKEKISKDFPSLRKALMLYRNDCEISDEVFERYVDEWANAKIGLYLMLGRNVIINKEFTCQASKKEVDKYWNNFCSRLQDNFFLDECISSEDVFNGVVNTKEILYRYLNQFDFNQNDYDDVTFDNIKEIVKNKVISPWLFKALEIKESMKGGDCKISKYIDKLFGSEIISQRFSVVTQGKKQKHNIHISIHPVDFLTMSMTKNWKSCSVPGNVGGGAGISYGLDKTTLIAYSANGFNTKMKECHCVPDLSIYDDFIWNDKRWRMLIYANYENGSATFYREYPNKICDLRDRLRGFYEETVSSVFDVENHWNVNNSYYKHINDVYNDYGEPNHYNDILNFRASKDSDKELAYIWLDNTDYKKQIQIGSSGFCLKCGKRPIYNKRTALCRECG